MAQIFSKIIGQLGWSSLPRFVLEMAVVRMCHLQDLAKVEQSLMQGSTSGAGGATTITMTTKPAASAAPAEAVAPRVMSPPPAPMRSGAPRAAVATAPQNFAPPDRVTASLPQDSEPEERFYPPSNPEPLPTPIGISSANPSAQSWRAFVDTVMKKRPLLGALLGHANFKVEPGEKGGKNVVLAFPEGFFDRQARDSRQQIEDQLKLFFGPQTTLVFSPETTDTSRSLEQTKQAEAAELKKTALEHPTVVKMKEIMGAEVIDVNVDV
jgi:hypothetical protein